MGSQLVTREGSPMKLRQLMQFQFILTGNNPPQVPYTSKGSWLSGQFQKISHMQHKYKISQILELHPRNLQSIIETQRKQNPIFSISLEIKTG